MPRARKGHHARERKNLGHLRHPPTPAHFSRAGRKGPKRGRGGPEARLGEGPHPEGLGLAGSARRAKFRPGAPYNGAQPGAERKEASTLPRPPSGWSRKAYISADGKGGGGRGWGKGRGRLRRA